MAEQIRAAIYSRVSTGAQAESGLGLADQEAACRAYIESQGWTFAGLYADRGVSGRQESRPELDRLLADLPELDRVVILRLDRLGRNARGMLELTERMRAAEVGLAAVRDSIDTATASGRMIFTVLSAMAEYESELIASRNVAAAGERVKRGRHHGRAPLGYVSRDGRLEPEPAEVAVVQRIFLESAQGKSQRQIAQRLTADGIPTKTGRKQWSQGAVATVLVNPVYIGRLIYNGEQLDGDHEPIIDPELFERVGRTIKRSPHRNRQPTGRDPAGSHLFIKGLLRCGLCGGAMTPRTDRGKETYRCLTRLEGGAGACAQAAIPRHPLDEAAYDYFARVGLDIDATRERLIEAAEAGVREVRSHREAAERAARQAAEAEARVRGDYFAGKIDADEWRELRGTLAAEREAADAKLAKVRAREREIEEAAAAAADPAERIAERLDALRRSIAGEVSAGRDLDAIRAALRSTFERFEVYPEPEPPDDPAEAAAAEVARVKIDAAADGELTVRADRWILVPTPRAEVIADLHAIAPVLRLAPLDLDPDDDDADDPDDDSGSSGGGPGGPAGTPPNYQKNAPPRYSPNTSRIALQTSPIDASAASASRIG